MEGFLGHFYSYFRPVEFPTMILRSLDSVFSRAGFVYVRTIENYSAVKRRKRAILKYTGIVFHTGERIVVHEREAYVGQMMWNTILLPARPTGCGLFDISSPIIPRDIRDAIGNEVASGESAFVARNRINAF